MYLWYKYETQREDYRVAIKKIRRFVYCGQEEIKGSLEIKQMCIFISKEKIYSDNEQ